MMRSSCSLSRARSSNSDNEMLPEMVNLLVIRALLAVYLLVGCNTWTHRGCKCRRRFP